MASLFFSRSQRTKLGGLLYPGALLLWIASANSPQIKAQTSPFEEESSVPESTTHWRKPPPHSRWEIFFQRDIPATDSDPKSDVKYRPLRVTVIRHGGDMLQEVLMEDGKRWETWILGQVQIQSISGASDVWMKPPLSKSNRAADVTDHHSFGEFRWIRKEHFRGTFTVQGVQAGVYLQPLRDRSEQELQKLRSAKKGPLGGLPLCEGVLAAAIHPDTRYPMLLQQGTVLRTYSITPLAQEVLSLPEKVIRFRELLSAPAKVTPTPLP